MILRCSSPCFCHLEKLESNKVKCGDDAWLWEQHHLQTQSSSGLRWHQPHSLPGR